MTNQQTRPNSVHLARHVLAVAVLTLASLISFAATSHSAQASPTSVKASPLKALTSSELNDLMKKNDSTKATIVNIWATWCAPCREEMPELLALRKAYAAKGLQLILVTADTEEDTGKAANFLKEINVDFPTYRLGEDPDTFVKAFVPNWPSTLPTTFVYDGKGQRSASWIGRISKAKLETEIERLLKGSPAKNTDTAKGTAEQKPEKKK